MKSARIYGWLLALAALFFITGCDQLADWFGDDDDDNDDDKAPFRYLSDFDLGARLGAVDPYDGSLDLIDPLTLDRYSIPTSPGFSALALTPAGDLVAMLDGEANLVRIVDPAAGRVEGEIAIGEGVNALRVSPTGDYLLGFYDPSAGEVDFGDSGVINYYELDVIDLVALAARPILIDFSPSQVVFAPSGRQCLLGSDHRLIWLDLESGAKVTYPLTLDPTESREPRDIAISPDGSTALVLINGTDDIFVLDLVNPTINILNLSGQAESVTFLPDSRLALLPVPDTGKLGIIDLDAAMPAEISLGETASRLLLNPDGTQVVLYREGGDQLIFYDPAMEEVTALPLNVLIESEEGRPSVAYSPDGRRILVVGQYGSGPSGKLDMDLVDLKKSIAFPIGLDASWIDYAFTPDSARVGVLLGERNKFIRLDLNSLQPVWWEIAAAARELHYLTELGIFAVQHHDRHGKITFIGDQGSDLYKIKRGFFDD